MKLIYEQQWSTYEEWGAVRILEDEHGAFWQQDGGYSVMASADEPDWYEPFPISYDVAIDLIEEWEQIASEDEDYWKNSY